MKKILAIDDQKDNLLSIKGFLKYFLPDCELFLAQSAKEGIAIAQKEQPDTILLDIIMPEMDGYDACKALKKDERTKFIPILMLSALGQDPQARAKGLELGADAFLAKPFIPIELKAQINVMLRIKEAEDKLRAEKENLEKVVKERTTELVESEEKYRNLVEQANDGICILQNNRVKFVNHYLGKLWGGSVTDIMDTPFTNYVHPDELEKLAEFYKKRIYNQNAPSKYETILKHKNGQKVYVEISAGLINYHGEPADLVVIRDITERKKAEEEQRRSEIRFKRLFDGLGDAVFVTRIGGKDKGRIIEVNTAALVQTGYSKEELLEKNIINDLYVDGSGEISSKDWEEELLKGGTVRTTERKRRKDGSEFWTEMIVTQIDFKGEKASLSINHDITNRKRAEQIQKAIYNISNAVITEDNLEKLIGFIRDELGVIIDTSNFYVALYDQDTDTLSLPFLVDETETRNNIPADKTLTYYVIKTEKSLLANKKRLRGLKDSGDIVNTGAEAEVWLGVPLKVEGKVIGVIAVQSYTNEKEYSKLDMEMLEFVSEQISISVMRKKAEDDLIIALNKATESDRLKSAFLATISHELRTPLNAVIGFSDLINNNWPLDEIYGFAKTINESGTHLLSIVEDIFDITLIETGDTTINKKDENLHLILRDIRKTIDNEQIKLKKDCLELNLQIPDNDVHLTIYTDMAKFKQIMLNLLKNALKFTHEGHINYGYTFIQQEDKKMIRFYIEDTGIGVPKDKQELIFTTFRQVEESFNKTYGGTGIGLSISTKLTELLGGKLWIESEEGVGSTFYFTIPFPNSQMDNINQEAVDVTDMNEDITSGDKTFLIVEDDNTSFEFLQIVLEKPDTKIVWAKDGKEAIKYCKEMPEINLVLMDINMQVMDGYEATKEIKAFRPQLPIIAQTAFAIAGDREKALKAGCDDYISKPIKFEDLMEKIEKLI